MFIVSRRILIILIIIFVNVVAAVIGIIFFAGKQAPLSGPKIEESSLASPPPARGPATVSPTAVENPFAPTPTPTFQNPFQKEQTQPYQNPFGP